MWRLEQAWLAPSLALTLLSAAFALLMIPDRSGMLPALMLLPFWMLVAGLVASYYGFFALGAARVRSPLAQIALFCRRKWRCALFLFLSFLLAGSNMIAFMWIKPLLNYLVPFWADPLLADVDHALFLGHDPWALLGWLNSTPTAIFYHRGWFGLMILTLMVVLAAPPSPQKSAVMMTYFLLWSVAGPLIHVMLPAAGPIFFDEMGYGDRFRALESAPETQEMANYLWSIYSGRSFGPGSGISAMPSLHIATTAWMIVAFSAFARRWLPMMVGAGFLIFLLSVSLGWHYVADGIVGGGTAIVIHRLLLRFYSRKQAAPVRRSLAPAST